MKELKGDSVLQDEEDTSFESSFIDHNNQIENARRNSDMIGFFTPDDDLLDQEYPPEGLMSDDELQVADNTLAKSSETQEKIISEVLVGSPQSSRSRTYTSFTRKTTRASVSSTRKGSTGSLKEEIERSRSPSIPRKQSIPITNRPKTPMSRPVSPIERVNEPNVSVNRDELIKRHRQSIKENTDYCKQESKILVNLTMKMGKQLLENPNGTVLVDEAFSKYLNELGTILEKKMEGMVELQNYISRLKSS